MRMGLHRHTGWADDTFRAYVDAVRPPFVKMLDPGEGENALAGWCASRGVATIGRNVFDGDEQRTGGTVLRQSIARVVGLARACPNIGYWELFNEAFDQPGDMAAYAGASIEFMAAMEAIGRKAVIGCFAQGTPEVTGDDAEREWEEYLPAVQRAIAGGHILGLHEYSGPFMDFEVTWHCLRYRRSLDILRGLGVDVARLKIAITESGIDDVWGRPGPQGKGYKPFQGSEWDRPPASIHGDYAGQLHWYGGELSRDPQIVGWVDFGWADGSGYWPDFDLSTDPAMLARVTVLQKALPGVAVSPPPVTGGGMNEATAAAIRAAADRAQVLRMNRAAAIQRAATRDGYTLVGNETEVTAGSVVYVAQKAEHPTSGGARYYYCVKPVWDKVYYLGGA